MKAYVSVMEEIKRRTAVIWSILNGERLSLYSAIDIELVVLQVRMILELIALASLAANKALFEQAQMKFHAKWEPHKILADIEKLNPNFYPVPIIEAPPTLAGAKADWIEIKDGFLTKSELIQIHGRCGFLLHATNPYSGRQRGYNDHKRLVTLWIERIQKLISCHQVRLLNRDRIYLVHMAEPGDENVHMYVFEARTFEEMIAIRAAKP